MKTIITDTTHVRIVAQVSKPAVSPISKSAGRPMSCDLRVWKPAIQQTWKSALQFAVAAAFLVAVSAPAEAVSLESAPPVVVKTAPVAGATSVDPALTEIRVTYSKAMQDGSWSWSTWGEENYPETTGQPRYLSDGRTCVLPVKLQPERFYAVWLNSDHFKNFKDKSGQPAVPYLLTFRTGQPGEPRPTSDNVAVEHLALRMLAAIRDKEDNVLKDMSVDRIKGWRDALPHFAFELRERLQQSTGKPFALQVGESLVEGDYAAVKCAGPKELEGKYLVLFFLKTDKGWLNCSLRNSPPATPLSSHLADCKAELQKMSAVSGGNDAGWQRLLNDDQRAVLAWTDRQFRSFFDSRTFEGWSDEERASLEKKLIDALNGPRSPEYFQAINTLPALRSTSALPKLRAIAFERVDRNNRDRWMCIRALGILGDKVSVPELIHLVYHGNVNTRWWAQLSLVRITGQNFAKDWNAWGKWWNGQNGQPPFKPEIIRWWNGQAEPDKLGESLDEGDQKFFESLKGKSAATPAATSSTEVAARLHKAKPVMEGIRGAWSAAVEAIQREDLTSALASLRVLAPRIEEFRDAMKGTSLEAGAAETLETLKPLTSALEKRNLEAARTAMEPMMALGRKMEAQVKAVTDASPGSAK